MSEFVSKRLQKFVLDFRNTQGLLATQKDIETAGFTKKDIDQAIKQEAIGEFYVTLTNGSIVRGYKAK